MRWVLIAGVASIVISTTWMLLDAVRANAFACGYLYGQRDSMVAGGLGFAAPRVEVVESCPGFLENARKHGFSTSAL